MKKIVVGMIGSGFAADLHAKSYRQIYGAEVVLKSVASVAPDVQAFAARFGFQSAVADYHALLADKEIDLIDIIAPPHLHTRMVIDALRSGKHVICEKPLTGCFGETDWAEGEAGSRMPKAEMLRRVREELALLRQESAAAKGTLFYAENFVYAPAIQKSVELLRAEKSRILFMRAEESHSGSHASHAANWKTSGGGAFIRQGCHPLSAVLYLKQQEALAHGETPARVVSVVADTGVVTAALSGDAHKYIAAQPADVEDIANVILTFSDGTKAIVMAGDMIVGGVRNNVEIYTNKSVHQCNLAPNNALMSYHEDTSGLDDVYFTEKVGTKAGWQPLFIEEERMRGYIDELQDFIQCALSGAQPQSGLELACQTIDVTYAAYQSADEGRRIFLV